MYKFLLIFYFYRSYHFMFRSFMLFGMNSLFAVAATEGKQAFMPDDDDENESSIRRACSLSDLSMGKGKEIFEFSMLPAADDASPFMLAHVSISFSMFCTKFIESSN